MGVCLLNHYAIIYWHRSRLMDIYVIPWLIIQYYLFILLLKLYQLRLQGLLFSPFVTWPLTWRCWALSPQQLAHWLPLRSLRPFWSRRLSLARDFSLSAPGLHPYLATLPLIRMIPSKHTVLIPPGGWQRHALYMFYTHSQFHHLKARQT